MADAGLADDALQDRAAAAAAPPGPARAFWQAFVANRGAAAGLAVVGFIVVVALLAGVVAPHSPIEQFRDAVKAPPVWDGGTWRFPLGTDSLGRDIASRLIHGARVSLFIGLTVMSVSVVAGVLLGLACASLGTVVDVLLTRVMDLVMAVPGLVMAILIVAVLGPSLADTIVAVTVVYLPRYVRLMRASALAELRKDYVVAARVAGVGPVRLMFRTVLPNCLGPLIVQAALGVSDAILEAAALGFLGLGAQPPTAEWGTMLADSRDFILSNPWMVTLPGLAILVTVVSINLAGDGLRDALDPEAAHDVMTLLDVRNLRVSFATRGGEFNAVDGIDLALDHDEVLAIVGESGSGKSVAMLAVMGLLPWTASVKADRLRFDGHDLLALEPGARRRIVGRDLSMIFQEPVTSLNPCFTVGWQVAEVLAQHTGLGRAQRRMRAVELLEQVGIPDAPRRLRAFPHQLSGGMCQRVMIAMALACNPKLLIADEPTTALDVTIQAQIMDLLMHLKQARRMALVLITHDLGLVAEHADRVVVQYAGRQVESGDADTLFDDPHHPYTAALLAALPERAGARRLQAIPGVVPGQFDRPRGCLFAPRCALADERCEAIAPAAAGPDLGRALCHYPLRLGVPLHRASDEEASA